MGWAAEFNSLSFFFCATILFVANQINGLKGLGEDEDGRMEAEPAPLSCGPHRTKAEGQER